MEDSLPGLSRPTGSLPVDLLFGRLAACGPSQASCLTSVRLARAEFGQELAFGFEPIATGVAGQAEAVAALGDKVGARPDHFVRGFRGAGRRGRFCGRFRSAYTGGGFLAGRLFRGHAALLLFAIQRRDRARRFAVLFGLIRFVFSRHQIRLAKVKLFASSFLTFGGEQGHDYDHRA